MTNTASINMQIFQISGLDCPDCTSSLEKLIQKIPGVQSATIQFPSGKLTVRHETAPEAIISLIEQQGYSAVLKSSDYTTVHTFNIQGLDCPDCTKSLEQLLLKRPGVKQVSLKFPSGKLLIEHTSPPGEIISLIQAQGYTVALEGLAVNKRAWWKDPATFSLFVGIILLAASFTLKASGYAGSLSYLFAFSVLTAGWPVFRAGSRSLLAGLLDMNVLMTIAVLGAAFLGDWLEAAAVVVLFGLGRALQAYTLANAERSLNALLTAAPSSVLKLVNGKSQEVDSATVQTGDTLLIRTGEVLAVDAVVQDGRAAVNQASVTGESLPRDVAPGDKLFAGSYPTDSQLTVTASSTMADSMLSRIKTLVENAQTEKPPSQEFVERFARIYTPIVIASTVLLVAVPWLLLGQPLDTWLYRGLVLLVVACPCALILSTPVATAAAISAASRLGILIKGGVALENAGKVKAIALDKTGTLSTGKLTVANLYAPHPFSKEEVLRLTAALETSSFHPAALAILAEAQNLELPPVKDINNQSGLGLSGLVDGKRVTAGNSSFLEKQGVNIAILLKKQMEYQALGASAVFVAIDGQAAGLFALMDNIKPDAAGAIAKLRSLGLEHIIMLTGDHEKAAASITGRLKLDAAVSGLLPQGKSAVIGKLRNQYGSVMMAGDGLNDAPALAKADVGVAVGAASSTAALEVADIALMNDKIELLPTLIEISKRSSRIIRQNTLLSVASKAFFLVLTLFDLTTLWLAVLTDTGVAVLVVLNSMRLLKVS